MARPLEDARAVDALRKDMRKDIGLDPLANYIRGMDEDFGPCPPAAPG